MIKKNLIQQSFLQSGQDLQIAKDIYFKHPTIQDVFNIDKEHNGLYSENTYYQYVNVFLTDPYLYMVYLDDKKLDYETVTPFELFILLYNDYADRFKLLEETYSKEQIQELFKNNAYFQAFNFFLGVDAFFIAKTESGKDVLVSKDNHVLMDSGIFDYVFEFVKEVNGIPDGDRINPEDDFAKQMLIEDKRDELKRKAKQNDENDDNKNRLGKLLSSVTWCTSSGITPFNRNNLHMYDLVEGVHRTDKLLNYKNTMVGLYSGCVDKKNIDFVKMHWSN